MQVLKSLTFDDVLLAPGYGNESRDDGSVEVKLGAYHYSIPIVSANMDTITGVEMAVTMARCGGLGLLHRFQSIEDNVNMFVKATALLDKHYDEVGVSIGVDDQERVDALYEVGARIFCVDVAHAHCKRVGKMVKALKACEDVYIIAGNVATYSGADYLSSVGADAIKVGIGAGSVCTTREVTGFGVPQLTAIMDCARIDKPIIADGGIRVPGDAVKALAAGARMVMLGGMLSGTDEVCGKPGIYRGMASKEAREDYYRATVGWRAAEGISVKVESKGPAADVVADVVGGIKSGLSYAGAKNLKELQRKATFIEVTPAIVAEGRPHAI